MPAARPRNVIIMVLGALTPIFVHSMVMSGSTDDRSEARAAGSLDRTTQTFEGIGDLSSIGTLGKASFSWVWLAVVDSDAGGCCEIANEPSPQAAAMIWDPPSTSADTRISFSEPMEAVSFHYSLDTSLGNVIAVFYDRWGEPIGRLLLNGCGSPLCGDPCSGDPTGTLCRFFYAGFSARGVEGISYIEFENLSAVYGRFAIGGLSYLSLDLIFSDGFETGDTSRWSNTVGLATPTTTPTPSYTSTYTPTPTVTPTLSHTITPTFTSTYTSTPTPTSTPTSTHTPTPTPTSTSTPTPTSTSG